MKVFYFTGTGNSLAVAKRIALGLGGDAISMPAVLRSGNLEYSDPDAIGLVFPTYCCYPPRIVREFLDKAELAAPYLFAVATYGNPMGGGGDAAEMAEFGKYAEKRGLSFSYLNSILMVDNFVDNFDVARERERISSKGIEEHLSSIVGDIRTRRSYAKKAGIAQRATTKICMPLVRKQDAGGTAARFSVSDACVLCGTCIKVCPRSNVAVADKVFFGGDCEGCYACVHACPKQAIHVKREKSAERWRNQNVKLSEIVAANSGS